MSSHNIDLVDGIDPAQVRNAWDIDRNQKAVRVTGGVLWTITT
jgi:hypothetical protein